MALTRDEYLELFDIRVRGALATAFSHSDTMPGKDHWDMLRGSTEITMRDVAVVGYLTHCEPTLEFTAGVVANEIPE